VKYTVIALGVVVAGTLAVLLFYKPAPPPTVLLPEKLPVIDPNAPKLAGDRGQVDVPQRFAAAPPLSPDQRVGKGHGTVVGAEPPREGTGSAPGSAPPGTGAGSPEAPGGVPGGADAGKPLPVFPPDKEGIRAAMQSRLPELAECYEAWLTTNPGLQGKMVLSFQIGSDGGDGDVHNIGLASSDIGHLPFEGCVKNVMADMRFTPPIDDSTGQPGPMTVRYPLVFSSSDGG